MSAGDLLLYLLAASALLGGLLMLVARHPMHVALALISSMLSLAGIYAMLGVHVIAVFQVLIYVGAVMVFMIYVIMLLDVRDPSFLQRYSRVLVPAVVLGALLAALLVYAVDTSGIAMPDTRSTAFPDAYLIGPFSREFLQDYWLHFELTSVLLVAAVVAAIAVLKGKGKNDGS